MPHVSELRIAIVGGSIAGCVAAAELARAGHDVSVFERGRQEPHGAGIGLLPITFGQLIDRGLTDSTLPHFEIREHAFSGRDGTGSALGRTALRLTAPTHALHWTHLFRALRKAVPEGAYHAGLGVDAVTRYSDTAVTLSLSDGSSADFDLVVFADGYRSLGRAVVCPDASLAYRGYTLWRGLCSTNGSSDAAPLEHTIHRLSHPSLPGHTALYSIHAAAPAAGARGPDVAPSERPERLVNWASYLPLPASALRAFLTDREGREHGGALAPGRMRPDEESRLKALVCAQLPSYFAALIARTTDTFAQPIYSGALPRHRAGRILLIGDAGSLAPPLTGSGVLKATANAITLAKQLRAQPDLETALSAWDAGASTMGRSLVQLGERMERALIWEMPNLSQLGASETLAWWTQATRWPT